MLPSRRPGQRLLTCALLALLFPAGASSSGRADEGAVDVAAQPAAPVRSFEVRWFNASAAALVPAEEDPVTQAIEKRFTVKLTLLGGPPSSRAFRQLDDDIANNLRLGPNDARRRALPDVFPWTATLSGIPALSDLFAPLPEDLVRRVMPRTWAGMRVLAAKQGLDPKDVWAPFTSNGVSYAIPRPNPGWQFPAGVLWRADVLDRLGLRVPSTIDEWEAVLRAIRNAFPSRVPWTSIRTGFPFLAVFGATGEELLDFVPTAAGLEPGLVQPQVRRVLQTLRRWYAGRFIALVEPAAVGGDANGLFVTGRSIVTVDARPEDGSWVCEEPYVVGSIPDLTARRIPEASFVLGPRPVFPGVTAPSAPGSSKAFGPLCFGFNRDLASEPARLERIMTVVDELAGESRMYLTAAFGIEGKQWTWERTSDGRWPKRLASSSPANTGRYWIFPWSPFEEQYDLAPRVLDSITSSFGTPRSLYGRASGAQPRFRIPYGDSGARATDEKARYETLYARIWTRFSEQVLYPVMYGTAGMSAFDDFLAWYHDNGGDELARIVTRWAAR